LRRGRFMYARYPALSSGVPGGRLILAAAAVSDALGPLAGGR
jgi:hypothetical protein